MAATRALRLHGGKGVPVWMRTWQLRLSWAAVWALAALKIKVDFFSPGDPREPHNYPLKFVQVTSPFAEKETEAW